MKEETKPSNPAPDSAAGSPIEVSRRQFMGVVGAVGVTAFAWPSLGGLAPVVGVNDPLAAYPSRDWEAVYRDQYRYDRTFTWICAPNDTHMCRMRAFVRNGIMVRSEQNYDSDKIGDCYGNRATVGWNPRGCPKGFTFQRRLYGPYRLRGPVVRKGWKQWADDGFPSLSDKPELRSKYKFDSRGSDTFVRLPWEEISTYVAKGMMAVAKTYSGDDGKRRLLADGYDPLMLKPWKGAGTSTMKMGSNLPIHGMVGKYGLYRLVNMTGLIDHHVRGVSADDAVGARDWNEYTWRGDQAPGGPFATGLQTSECDINDLRYSRFLLHVGKNLVENKMADTHWFIETMERGGKIVCITPDYAAPSAKSDYWIGVRPGLSDLAVLLGVAKLIIDNNWHDVDFCRRFTDFPLLVRTDNLQRLRPQDVFKGYVIKDIKGGPSYKAHGLTDEQRQSIGDFCMWDAKKGQVVAVSRDEVGEKLAFEPALDGTFTVETIDGKRVEVMPVLEMYRRHLKDYDLKTVQELSGADPVLVERLAKDLATIKPAAIHVGEGVNHYFHATLHNRVCFMLVALTGNIGKHGTGSHTWAGNYKGALFQGASWAGPGVGAYIYEDPFNPVLDEKGVIDHHHMRHCSSNEEPSYWAYGEKVLKIKTAQGEKLFTGQTHLPTPTKLIWYNNANFLNQSKWIYDLIQNVLPKVDMIIDQQMEWTGSAEYADIVLPVNSWVEFQDLEIGGSCSNPFIQAWGGDALKPVHDSRDDAMVFSLVGDAFTAITGDKRFSDYWKYIKERKSRVYIQRVLDSCITTRGKDGPYQIDRMMRGEYGGQPGSALWLFRTYPRVAFYEQVHDNVPFYTDSGRLASYCDLPEAIEYGENLIVHREGVEATPYLPNVIVSTSPYIRPQSYGIALDSLDPDERSVRNVKMSWEEVKKTVNPLWAQGFRFFCSTPKSRHSTHSSWSTVDWNWIWSCNHGDPYRADKRAPGVGDRQIQMNPQAAKDLGLNAGDYVWVDANPQDRPYRGWKENDFRYRAFRCMVRLKVNPALPYHMTIMKHTGWIASERTVKAAESRPDGQALAEDTGYQASYRYGSHQSITRGWLPPMHQTDTLFHKKTGGMGFKYGSDVDNHAINTVPKETLVRVIKAEDGGIGGKGIWAPALSGFGPESHEPKNLAYLSGSLTTLGTPGGGDEY
ncbi:MAG: molybdopterin-dependent oxidoreductase [Phycisphaeraceae bacterium]|nr:molybdopterin-dependent oxidoreductase [Phycisphaeraceae bacterium]